MQILLLLMQYLVLLGKRGMDDGWIKNRYTVDTVHIFGGHIHWMYTQYLNFVHTPRIRIAGVLILLADRKCKKSK